MRCHVPGLIPAAQVVRPKSHERETEPGFQGEAQEATKGFPTQRLATCSSVPDLHPLSRGATATMTTGRTASFRWPGELARPRVEGVLGECREWPMKALRDADSVSPKADLDECSPHVPIDSRRKDPG